jgi:uncharacterized protein (TIGR00299 family) protein
MTLAYFDCFAGISGDMTLGALVDLGVPVSYLKTEIARLPLTDFDIVSDRVSANGIGAVKIAVSAPVGQLRDYRQIRELIERSPLLPTVKAKSISVFETIAEAEAKIHGCVKERVHFHEVGGVDAIVDIVGTCLALNYLGIDEVIVSALPLGHGTTQSLHGTIPIPAPATMEILKGRPVYDGGEEKELVTPTGAAIAATLGRTFGTLPPMAIERVGYGAGSYRLESRPNLLRVVVGQRRGKDAPLHAERVTVIEAAVDDMNPEFYGFLMEKLFLDGALDVLWIPAQMKKNRPGTLIQVLCAPERRDGIVARMLSETTSLGVRYYDVERAALARRSVTVQSPWGPIVAKEVTDLSGTARIVPEFEACRQIADTHRIPLREVYQAIKK